MEQSTEKPDLGNMQPTVQGYAFLVTTLMKKNGWTAEETHRRIAEAARRAGRHYAEEQARTERTVTHGKRDGL